VYLFYLYVGLLVRDPKSRLGANGAEEIKRMKFFETVDWAKIENLTAIPPYVPENDINAASQSDIGSFDASITKGIKLTEKDQAFYSEWDYLCVDTFQKEAIEYLEWEIKNGPCNVAPNSSNCCTIL
jgi:hypothetical protein